MLTGTLSVDAIKTLKLWKPYKLFIILFTEAIKKIIKLKQTNTIDNIHVDLSVNIVYFFSFLRLALDAYFRRVVLFISFCLFDLILYVPSTIFQLNRDASSWFEPVLS